jgi:hypothetical protein
LDSFDDTLQNFIKRKHPKKGEKKKQRARIKVEARKQPKRGAPHGGNGITKYKNLHQSFEAYQLKKGEVSPIKLQAQKNPPLQ